MKTNKTWNLIVFAILGIGILFIGCGERKVEESKQFDWRTKMDFFAWKKLDSITYDEKHNIIPRTEGLDKVEKEVFDKVIHHFHKDTFMHQFLHLYYYGTIKVDSLEFPIVHCDYEYDGDYDEFHLLHLKHDGTIDSTSVIATSNFIAECFGRTNFVRGDMGITTITEYNGCYNTDYADSVELDTIYKLIDFYLKDGKLIMEELGC